MLPRQSCRSGVCSLRMTQGKFQAAAMPAMALQSNCRLVLHIVRASCDHRLLWLYRLRQLEGKIATLTVINEALQKENDSQREVCGVAGTPCWLFDFPAHPNRCLLHQKAHSSGIASPLNRDAILIICCHPAKADGDSAHAAAELAELQEEFQRRLGAADRTIAALKVHHPDH